ncbi:DUF2255 family protein [Klebsiella michiganensis]|uniref:DUF2255 family protein n=3 Tax=Klebsiella TaxID=570 RepID=UPI003D6FFD10
MVKEKLVDHIHALDVVDIRTFDYPEYSKIWVVSVNNRMFARSWGKSKTSWYWAFKQNGIGIMRIDNSEYKIRAFVPQDIDSLHDKINSAYQERYGSGEAAMVAKAMQSRSRWEMTLEFEVI